MNCVLSEFNLRLFEDIHAVVNLKDAIGHTFVRWNLKHSPYQTYTAVHRRYGWNIRRIQEEKQRP